MLSVQNTHFILNYNCNLAQTNQNKDLAAWANQSSFPSSIFIMATELNTEYKSRRAHEVELIIW